LSDTVDFQLSVQDENAKWAAKGCGRPETTSLINSAIFLDIEKSALKPQYLAFYATYFQKHPLWGDVDRKLRHITESFT
jgi:hypothetical protein